MLNQRIDQLPLSGIRRLFSIAQEIKDIISFGIGEPDFPTPDHIVEAGIKALREGHHHYTGNLGDMALRTAIAHKVTTENHIKVGPENIVVTHGGTGALFNAFTAILNPGDEVIIPDPGFLYNPYLAYMGATPVWLALRGEDKFHINITALKKLLSPKTKALIINSPHNPSGAVYTKEELQTIAELAIEHNFFVISDEVYEKMVYDGRQHYSIASFPGMLDRTITVNALSKTYAMTGWRIGYAVCREDIVTQMLKIQQNVYTCATAVSQRAALAAITGPQDCTDQMCREYDTRRRAMFEILKTVPGIKPYLPEATFYMLVDVSQLGIEVNALANSLITEQHVATIPGDAFGPDGKNYLRFCFTVPVPQIEEGLRRFIAGIENLTK